MVIYQGAPGWGCAGSLMSGPAWLWMLTAKRATSAAWMNTDIRGYKTDVMNMTPLHRRMKTERTEITTLYSVVLDNVSRQYPGLTGRACKQWSPWQRRCDRPVICDGVDDLIGIAIPPMIGSFLPKASAV